MPMRPADELGPILASRSRAQDLRHRLETEIRDGGTATLDFSGVEMMSPSFADELVAKLPDPLRAHVQLVNLSDDLRSLVDAVSLSRSNS
jgi:anti-anti-sigma regulatory factor